MAAEEEKKSFEILESPEALADQISHTEEFLSKNRNMIAAFVGGILLLIGGYFGYQYYMEEAETEAQNAMFPAVFFFESDSLNAALNGTKTGTQGLLSIAEEFSGTKAGNLANFYIGTIYLKQGKFSEAIEALEKFSSDDALVQPRAWSLIGDAYSEQGKYEEAESWYKKAADYKANKYFTPTYLMKLAFVQEKQNNWSGAVTSYTTLIEKFYDSQESADARKYRALAEQKSGSK